jgi:hypothetical protein
MRPCLLALAAVALAVLPGCGSEDEAPPSPVGTWVIELDHYAEQMLAFTKDMPGAPKDAEYFRKAAQVEVEVKADGTWTSIGRIEKHSINETGVWSLAGDELTIEWQTRSGKPAPKWVQTVRFDG